MTKNEAISKAMSKIENRLRAVYNKGFEDGKNEGFRIASEMLRETIAPYISKEAKNEDS